MDFIPNLSGHKRNAKFESTVRGALVIVGPVVCAIFSLWCGILGETDLGFYWNCRILFIRRIVQIWYTRSGDAEGTHLFPPFLSVHDGYQWTGGASWGVYAPLPRTTVFKEVA